MKRQSDPDYRDNQARAQQAWRKRNSVYWLEYRRTHPQYVERNRERQRERNRLHRERVIAKKDASPPTFRVPAGIYRISPARAAGIAKMDVWTVEITLLSERYTRPAGYCKERTR